MLRNYFQSIGDQDYSSKTLEVILLTLMATLLFVSGGFFEMPEYSVRWENTIIAVYALCTAMFIVNRRGKTRLASFLLISGLWTIITTLVVTGGGISTIATFVYVIIVYIAGIQLGIKAGFITSGICILTLIALVFGGTRS